jgi:hypothetical protein
MSVTVAQSVIDIRSAVKDETGTVWDKTADILPRINEALQHLYAVRPAAFYVTKIVVAPPAALTALTGNLPVMDHYAPAVVAYAAHLLLMQGKRDGDIELAGVNRDKWSSIVFPRRR